MAGLGGADYGAHAAEAAAPGEPLREPVDELRETLVQRSLRGGKVLEVGCAGVAGADEGEYSRPRRLGCRDERLQRVKAEQRVDSEGVDTETGDRPPGGGGLTDQRLRVSSGGDRDVTALAVGDDEEAGRPRRLADLGQGRPARRSEALEAGELGLCRDAGGARSLDQRPAVGRDSRRGTLGGACAPIATGLAGADLGRVRIEAEADLAAALFDERRQPIREWAQGRFSP